METLTPTSDDKTWGMLTHLSALLGFFLPFGSIIGPLIAWSVRKEQSAFVDDNGKSAVNFNLTWTLMLIALWAVWLMFFFALFHGIFLEMILDKPIAPEFMAADILTAILLFIPIGAVYVFRFLLMLVATIRASSGDVFTYPLTYRFIK